MNVRFVIVLADSDPVARNVGEAWGGLPALSGSVDGAPLRQLTEGTAVLRRPGPHIHDEGLDRRLPSALHELRPTLIIPSIHRSAAGPVCFTVHPLGNFGSGAEVGGAPATLVPSAPRPMTALLRSLAEASAPLGLPATFEATHHGPPLELPAFFAEIGGGPTPEHPDREQVDVLARALRELAVEETDRVAVGVGGGHYMPHFTDLALRRWWAFGHLISRHAIEEITPSLARAARELTTDAEGFLFARAADAERPAFLGVAPRLRDQDAPPRGGITGSSSASPGAGT